MNEDRIPKAECDVLSDAIEKIISAEVLEESKTNHLPLTDDLTDANKIYQAKIAVLFVDMRGSTKLPDKYNTEQLVKIYRSYVRTVVQSIRYSGGVVRDFMGDGVLAFFEEDTMGKPEEKAVRAARYIATAIDKFLNPVLDREIKHRISCGIGIYTGIVSLSKVGMKGKEQDDEAENEYGIAWIGNSTNMACKFGGAVNNSTIFISPSTYVELSEQDNKQHWKEIDISHNGNQLHGYIANQYYLQIDKNIVPCIASDSFKLISFIDELKKEYEKQCIDTSQRFEQIGKREAILEVKEKDISKREKEIANKMAANNRKEESLNQQEYRFYLGVISRAYCKAEYAKAMGSIFWQDNLCNAIQVGQLIGKNACEVIQEISYAMVSIYKDLEMWDKAYDFLVEQATGYPWLLLSTVQKIVNKIGYCSQLKLAVNARIIRGDLSEENNKEFIKIQNWLKTK